MEIALRHETADAIRVREPEALDEKLPVAADVQDADLPELLEASR